MPLPIAKFATNSEKAHLLDSYRLDYLFPAPSNGPFGGPTDTPRDIASKKGWFAGYR